MKVCKEIVLLSLGAILAVLKQVTVSLGLVRWVRTKGNLSSARTVEEYPRTRFPEEVGFVFCLLPLESITLGVEETESIFLSVPYFWQLIPSCTRILINGLT